MIVNVTLSEYSQIFEDELIIIFSMMKSDQESIEIEANNNAVKFLPSTFSLKIPVDENACNENQPITSTSTEIANKDKEFRISVVIKDPKTGHAIYEIKRRK